MYFLGCLKLRLPSKELDDVEAYSSFAALLGRSFPIEKHLNYSQTVYC